MKNNDLFEIAALEKYFKNMKKKRVLVIGDVMLDQFVDGDVRRLSPESPVPVLSYQSTLAMPGGAGNVAANLAALGVKPVLCGVIGDDNHGALLQKTLKERAIDIEALISVPNFPTITKTRYVSGPHHLLRLDHEIPLTRAHIDHETIMTTITPLIKDSDAIILSDYNKGMLDKERIQAIIQLANHHKKPVFADPKKNDIALYNGVTLLTPNIKEWRAIQNHTMENDDTGATDQQLEESAAKVLKPLAIANLLITRSEKGMSLFETGQNNALQTTHIKAQTQDIFDVSGAGDTVIATLAAFYVAGAPMQKAAIAANFAAGLAVQKRGTSTISRDDFISGLQQDDLAQESLATEGTFLSPLMEWNDAAAHIKQWQRQGHKIGFTNGCFDIVHFGHVHYLSQARARCDKLVLGLNHDQSVRLLKGDTRPLHDENARAAVIGALASVDLVVLFGAQNKGDDNTPCALLDAIRPDVIFKGGDYTIDQLPEAKIVQAYGGKVDIMPLYEGHSTTGTIAKMNTKIDTKTNKN